MLFDVNTTFSPGMMVRIINDSDARHFFNGMTGTIICVHEDYEYPDDPLWGVDLDFSHIPRALWNDYGHTLDGHISTPTGRWVFQRGLELI